MRYSKVFGLFIALAVCSLAVALAASLPFASEVEAAGFVVNSLGDAADANVGDGICATASGVCTLRAALEEANANGATADTITFSVAGPISLTAGLPTLSSGNTAIAGANQTVTISGGIAGTNCLVVTSAGNVIRGLALSCSSRGIWLRGANNTIGGSTAAERNVIAGNGFVGVDIDGSGAHDNHVIGNYIGVNASGAVAASNYEGIRIEGGASSNVIGGSTDGERNVISGNTSYGVQITGGNTSGNLLVGNYVGTNAAGDAALRNQYGGVVICEGADNNTIGGSSASDRNVISGNGGDGVAVGANFLPHPSGTTVIGNYIGINAAGNAALPNGRDGVVVRGDNNTVGGAGETERNVMSGNGSCGVELQGGDNTASGNYVGINAAGNAALPNGCGVSVFGHNNTIGGASAEERNVISANRGVGVTLGLTSSGNKLSGNYIGTNKDGDAALPNESVGLSLGGQNNTIGGSTAGEGNVISGNGRQGVEIYGQNTSGNRVMGNHIGIDAAGNAALPNSYEGVRIRGGAHDNVIGGSTDEERNVISGNSHGVQVDGTDTSSNRVMGNYIGTNAAGDAALPNRGDGVFIWQGHDNTIGGSNAGEGNVISGNGFRGIRIDASGNKVIGNYIGTNADGDGAIPNGPDPVYIHQGYGVWVWQGPQDTIIGGPTAGERNVISGNGSTGLVIAGDDTSGTKVLGNYVGTNADGDAALPNQGDGVWVWDGAPGTVIGGPTAGERNVISGNAGVGIEFGWFSTVPTDTRVIGNHIGTDATGNVALPNQGDGVEVWFGHNITIGGSATGEGNVISGNMGDGIEIESSSNVVRGNQIGTNAAGDAALPNQGNGVLVSGDQYTADSNAIGGTAVGEGNTIANNNGDGVRVSGLAAVGNRIRGNSIHYSGGKGIELVNGGNTELAPPVITSVSPVSGTACANCIVDIYSDDDGEGRVYEGSTTAGPGGAFTWPGTPNGPNVTAAVTDASGNTSEFSSPAALAPDLIETAVSNPPASQNRGTSFSVTDTAKNRKGQQAGRSYTRYYLSLDTLRNTGDKLLTGKRSVPALAPGATSTGTKSVTIPGNTALGTYFLLACADDTLLVPESHETNNCIASASTILVTAPDLKETALTNPPASVKQGGSFNVTDTTANVGTGPAGASTTRYYLSLDKAKGATDVLLTGSRAVPALTAGANSSGTIGVTLAPLTPLGTYYLLACADDLKVVKFEIKEGNNCRASASKVQVTAP